MADETISTRIVANADFSSLIADVHKVTSSLSKLQEQLSNSNKMLANNVALMNRNFADTLRSTGQYSTHFVSLTSNVEKFGKNLDSGRLKLKDYFGTFQQHVKTSGGLIRELAKQQVAMQNAILQPLGRNAQGLMQFNVHVPRGLDEIKNKTAIARQELQIMNRVIQDGSVQLINWGKNTQWAGRQLTVGLALPMAAFGKASADAFRQADEQLVRLTKVYGGLQATSSAELAKVRKDVTETARQLASGYGASFKDTLALSADIAATGKTGNELLGSIKETTRLAVLGEVDRQDAMKATLALQSAFKQNTDQLSESINFLNAVENQTSTTLGDLIEAIPKAGPVVEGLGGNVKDLALYLTAMKEGGVNAVEGANALKSALASLINPTKVATGMFADFGIDLKGIVTSNAGDLTKTILSLQSALDTLNPLQKQQALEQLFGKFQFARMNALFENLGRQGSQTLQVLDLMKASSQDLANIAGRELSQVTESASGKYRRAIESLRADLAGVGDQFLSISTKMINIVDKAIKFFEGLPKPIKSAITFLGALTALAGPLIMITGVLANFFGYILKGIMHMKAFFKGGEGWKYLTPEMLAAEKAGKLVEASFYSDAKAASVLQLALKNLIDEFSILEAKAKAGAISVNPAVTTMSGNIVMGAGLREAVAGHPLAGAMGTRASTHMVPRAALSEEQRMQQTIFGLVPGSIPVNRKIGDAPQIYMNQPLPIVPGLTQVGGVSTGVVSGEAARWHTMMATLAIQSKQEIEVLKKQIATTGIVSKDFMQQFDDILPIVSKFTDKAAQESATIVAELRAGKLTVDQARSKIIALNLEIEQMMGAAVGTYATSTGRTLNPTIVPTLNQPVVDASGKSNMRELFKKSKTRDLIDKVARSVGVRTSGAGYNIETTRPKKLNMGGPVYMSSGAVVPGPNVNSDVVPAMLTPGEFVVNRKATAENLPLLMAINNGAGSGGPGYATGGEIQAWNDLRDINNRMFSSPNWEQEVRTRSIMHDAAILMDRGLSTDDAIKFATKDYDDAWSASLNKDGFIDKDKWRKSRQITAMRRQKHLRKLRAGQIRAGVTNPIKEMTRTGAGIRPSKELLMAVQGRAESLGGKAVVDKIFGSLFGSDWEKNPNFASRVHSEHTSPRSSWGYRMMGNYGQAMLGEESINVRTNRMRTVSGGLLPDEVIMTNRGLSSYERQSLRRGINPRNMPSATRFLGMPTWLSRAVRGFGDRRMSFRTAFAANSGGIVPGYNNGGVVYARTGKLIPAFKSGLAQGKKAGPREFGTSATSQMLGMGLLFGGQMVGGPIGQAMQIGGLAASFLPMLAPLGRMVKAMGSLTGLVTKFGVISGRVFMAVRTGITAMLGPVGLAITAFTVLAAIIIKSRKDAAENKRDQESMFGVTKKSADELGIKYKTLTDRMKDVREEQKLLADQAKAKFETFTSAGVTGLTLTIQQLKELKDRVKKDMPETLAILNNIDSSAVNDWASNLKAQMVASGKSIEEATNLIYALIEVSNKAGMGVRAISSKAFSEITDKATSANYIIQNLAKNIDILSGIDPSAFASNVDTAISSLDSAVQALIGTKDATGKAITEAQALAIQFENMSNAKIKDKQLGEEVLKTLKSQRPELAGILNQTDTIGGMYAKWRIYIQGANLDLSQLSSAQAETLAAFITNLEQAGGAALDTKQGVAGLEEAAALLGILRDKYEAANKAASKDISTTGLTKERIKAIEKEIKAIRDRAEAKKKALKDELDSENTQLEMQKLQLEYQQALARGDQDAAAAAQISIQQLNKQYQTQKAMDKIDENAKKEEEKQQAILDADAAYKSKIQDAANSSSSTAKKLAGQIKTITDIGSELANVVKLKDFSETKNATQQDRDAFQRAFANALNSIAVAAKSDPKILEAYGQFLSKDSKGNYIKDAKGNYIPESTSQTQLLSDRKGGVLRIPEGKALTELNQLQSGMNKFALDLMGPQKKSLTDIYNILDKGAIKPPTMVTTKDIAGSNETNLSFKDKTDIIKKYKLVKGDTFQTPGGYIYKVDASYNAGALSWDRIRGASATRMAYGGYIKHYNPGGNVNGPGTATSDSIPAYLSNGEYVIRASSVDKYGKNFFDGLNAQRFDKGGKAKPFEWQAYKGKNSFLKDMDTSYLGGFRGAYNFLIRPLIFSGSRMMSTDKNKNYKWNDMLYDAANIGSLGLGVKVKSGAEALSPLARMAFEKATARQGVQVFDKRFPNLINNMMEMGHLKPSNVKLRADELLTEYQKWAKTGYGDSPLIKAGNPKQSLNIYTDSQLLWKQEMFGTKGIKEKLSYASSAIKQILKGRSPTAFEANGIANVSNRGHSGSPNTIIHELGHRNLDLMGGPWTIAKLMGSNLTNTMKSPIHEAYAQVFEHWAGMGPKLRAPAYSGPLSKIKSPFNNGAFYNHPGTSLAENIWSHLFNTAPGVASDRTYQHGTQWLIPFANTIETLMKTSFKEADPLLRSSYIPNKSIANARTLAEFVNKAFTSPYENRLWANALKPYTNRIKSPKELVAMGDAKFNALRQLTSNEYNVLELIKNLDSSEILQLIGKISLNGKAAGGYIGKLHSWNGQVPGPYGKEVNAILKAGTEGVYQTDYIKSLQNQGNITYNISPTINAAPGMNEEKLADLASRKTIDMLNKMKSIEAAKVGRPRTVGGNYVSA